MDLVVVLFVVALLIAVAAAYVFFAARKARFVREMERVPPVPRVPGLKVRRLVDPVPAARTPREPVVESVHTTPPPSPPPSSSPAPSPGAPAAPLFDLGREPARTNGPAAPAGSGATAAPREIGWWKQFDARSATLDDTARLRLIGDLGVVAKEWCVPLLIEAYQEERRPGHRQAALIALAACRSRAAGVAFRRAMASGDAAERAIAIDGLADLEPPAPQTNIRRTVERH